MNSPTDVLRDEHRVILEALSVVETAAGRLAGGEALPDGWWEDAVAWLRTFADGSHHAKEERALFPAMVKAGVPSEGGPIGVMLAEHEEGRECLRAMADGPAAERAAAARQYVRLLRQHIDKENNVLFALAEFALDHQAQRAVREEFEGIEAEQGAPLLAVGATALGRLARTLGV